LAKTEISAEDKAQLLLETVEDRKAEAPLLMDLRGKTVLADYFLICTGLSNVHIRAIADHVMEAVRERNLRPPQIEGANVGEWVLMDFGDVILHIMNEEARERFKLEEFWTTYQPHGALPPEPGMEAAESGVDETDGDESDEDFDLDEDDLEDAEFFDDADAELEPLEDEEEIEDEADLPAQPITGKPRPEATSRN
jgi:ribosome-associated protein